MLIRTCDSSILTELGYCINSIYTSLICMFQESSHFYNPVIESWSLTLTNSKDKSTILYLMGVYKNLYKTIDDEQANLDT